MENYNKTHSFDVVVKRFLRALSQDKNFSLIFKYQDNSGLSQSILKNSFNWCVKRFHLKSVFHRTGLGIPWRVQMVGLDFAFKI